MTSLSVAVSLGSMGQLWVASVSWLQARNKSTNGFFFSSLADETLRRDYEDLGLLGLGAYYFSWHDGMLTPLQETSHT